MEKNVLYKKVLNLPDELNTHTVFELIPRENREAIGTQMLDRLRGWYSSKEIDFLREHVFGFVGMGGMGGEGAKNAHRFGIPLKITDCDIFEYSNLGRQYGATLSTIGQNKAFATARMLRDIFDGNRMIVDTRGIVPESVDAFIDGCDLIFDEIEFWAIGSRLLLHQKAREKNIPMINCNTIGHTTNFFIFDETSIPLEKFWDIDLETAQLLQDKIQSGTASQEEQDLVMNMVFRAFVPLGIPEHSKDTRIFSTQQAVLDRFSKGEVPIDGINAIKSAADMVQRACMYLINKHTDNKRNIRLPKSFPSGDNFNSLTRETTIFDRQR